MVYKRAVLAYTLRIWLSSVFIPPIILLIITSGIETRDELAANKPYGLLILVLTGLVLSIPSAALFYITCLFVNKMKAALPSKKNYLSLAAILLTVSPFMVIDWNDYEQSRRDLAIYMFCYIIVVITSLWCYDIKPFKGKAQKPQQTHHLS